MLEPQLVASLAPPLVGTLAGYVASRLTLFLLFRPRRPWRLAGVRVPMTPGAFALGRGQLAAAIGQVVGSAPPGHDTLGNALADPRLHEHLHQAVAGRLGALLHRDLGPAASLVPARFRALSEMGGKVARLRLQQLLHRHLDSPAFADLLRHELAGHDQAAQGTGETIALLRSPQGKRLIDTLFADLINEKVMGQPIGPLANLLPTEVQEAVTGLLAREAQLLLAELGPELAASLDSGAMASRRIEALSPHEYESLLRTAIAGRANLIPLLGALLGLALGVAATLSLHFC